MLLIDVGFGRPRREQSFSSFLNHRLLDYRDGAASWEGDVDNSTVEIDDNLISSSEVDALSLQNALSSDLEAVLADNQYPQLVLPFEVLQESVYS